MPLPNAFPPFHPHSLIQESPSQVLALSEFFVGHNTLDYFNPLTYMGGLVPPQVPSLRLAQGFKKTAIMCPSCAKANLRWSHLPDIPSSPVCRRVLPASSVCVWNIVRGRVGQHKPRLLNIGIQTQLERNQSGNNRQAERQEPPPGTAYRGPQKASKP